MNDLISGSLTDAIEKLASMAADLRTRPRTYAEKVAAGASDFLSSLGEQVKNNPALSHALVGGGLGAAAGGVNTMLGNRGKEEGQRKGLLGGMFTGTLAGAAAGGGIGMARMGLENMKQPGGAGHATMGHDALKPGQFEAGGQKMMIDPKALKDNPNLHRQIKDLTTPNFQTTLASGVGGVLQGIQERTPTMSGILPYVAAADLAMHGPGFGMARTTADRVGGHAGRKWLSEGIGSLEHVSDKMKKVISNNADVGRSKNLKVDIPGYTPSGPPNLLKRTWNRIAGNGGGEYGARDVVGGRTTPSTGVDAAIKIKYPKTKEVDKIKYDATTGKPADKWKETERVRKGGKTVIEKEHLNHAQIATAKNNAAKADPYFAGRSIFRFPGTNRVYRGGAFGLRAGVYSVPLATEYLARGLDEHTKNQKSLRELMAQHAKPVPEK